MSWVCNQCPRRCGVDRINTLGYCRSPYLPVISRVGLHKWEEPIISGTNGSGTIFFAGCHLQCVYCQNYAISHNNMGRTASVAELAQAMRDLVAQGAHNINFVNPTHYVHAILASLKLYRPPVPLVYNSSGYENVDTLKQLADTIDIYLPDCKYLDATLSARYSCAAGYPDVVLQALDEMVAQRPTLQFDENGMLQSGVVIRHLVLPGYSSQSVALLKTLYNRYGDKVYYSIMSQYTPYGMVADYPEINRQLIPLEYTRCVACMQRLGAQNVFIQDMTSADTAYIPPFEGDKE